MVVTVSPAKADHKGYQKNRMPSYLRRTYIEFVKSFCVGTICPLPNHSITQCGISQVVEQPCRAYRLTHYCRLQQQSLASHTRFDCCGLQS